MNVFIMVAPAVALAAGFAAGGTLIRGNDLYFTFVGGVMLVMTTFATGSFLSEVPPDGYEFWLFMSVAALFTGCFSLLFQTLLPEAVNRIADRFTRNTT